MKNTVKTFILMAALTGLFMAGGKALGGNSGLVMALVMALGLNFFSYWNSDKIALKMNGAQEVSPAEAPELHKIVEELAVRAELPKPRVYLIHNQTPNAFATGRNPEHAAVAATAGLLNLLNHDEITGVLAHEMGHIKHHDILISSVAAVMAGAIGYLATMAQWGMMFGGGRRNSEGGGGISTIIMMIVAPLAASIIQMAISRNREYLADKAGAEISGNPKSLASALQKLTSYNTQAPMDVNPASAQMYIVNPLSGKSLAGLFSTHPPMEERIRRLMDMK